MKLKSLVALQLIYIKMFVLGISAFTLITGCASHPVVYPNYKVKPKISISADTISTITEIPAGDYLIPESQVFIGGQGRVNPASAIFGVAGVLTNIAIIQSDNESSLDVTNLHVKFNTQLTEAFNREPYLKKYASKFQLVETEAASDIKLLPSAKFDILADSRIRLTFTLTVRFKDDVSGSTGIKNYHYAVGDIRQSSGDGGWTDNNAAAFKEASIRALNLLAQIFLQDITGEFRGTLESDKQHLIQWKTILGEQVFTVLLLREYPTYFVVTPMPNKTSIEIVERSLVRLIR